MFGNGTLSLLGQEHRIAVEIAKKGHKVYLLKNPVSTLFEIGKLGSNPNLICIEVPANQYSIDMLQIEDKIDVCLGMDQSVSPFVAEYRSRMGVPSLCLFLDLPVHVIDVNNQDQFNYNYQYSQRFYYWLNCALNFDSTIWISYVSGEEWRKRYKRDYEVIDYPVSYDHYYNETVADKTEDYVFGCHRVVRYKGSELLALAMLKTPYKFKHSFVSGDEQLINEYKQYLAPMSDRTELIKASSEKRKMELYYNARMVVYPQVTEWVSGLSLIEGFSVKTAGVCFDYPILRECYEDVAIYVKPRSFGELRKAITHLWEDDTERKERAAKGYELYLRRFTNECGADQLITILKKYING